MRAQFLVDGGGAIHLPQPAFTNYVLAPHYYSFVGQENITSTVTAGTFVPFPEVHLPCVASPQKDVPLWHAANPADLPSVPCATYKA